MTEVTTFVFWASPYFSFLVTEGHFKALCRPVLFGQILNIQTNLRQLKRTISGEIHKQRMAESEMEVYNHYISQQKDEQKKKTVGVGQNLKPSLFGKIKSLNRVKRAFFKRGILYLFHNSITQLKSRDQDLNPSPHTQKYRIVLKKTMSEFQEQLHIFFHLHRISPAFVACSWQTGQQGVLSPSFPTCPPPPVTRPFPPGRSCPLHLTSTNRLLPTPRQMFRMNQIFYSTTMTSSHQVQSCENFAQNAFLALKTKTPPLPSRPVRRPGDLNKPGRFPCCVFRISLLSFSYFLSKFFIFPSCVFHNSILCFSYLCCVFYVSLLCFPYFPAVFFIFPICVFHISLRCLSYFPAVFFIFICSVFQLSILIFTFPFCVFHISLLCFS